MKIKDLMLFMTILVLQVQKLVGPAKLRAVFAMKMRNVSQEQVANNRKLHSKMKNQISTRTSKYQGEFNTAGEAESRLSLFLPHPLFPTITEAACKLN